MKKSILILSAIYIILYLLPLGYRPLILPDETRYAEIPREMIANGEWIVPRLNGLRYFEKPVMGYWLTALTIKIFGENNWAVRLPSALAAGLSAVWIGAFLWKATANLRLGLMATAALLVCLQWFGVGTVNVLDQMLSLWLTAALVCYYWAYEQRGERGGQVHLMFFGIFCGLAFLTKGFLALVIPMIVIVPFLVWERRWRELVALAGIPLTAALMTVLPWAILIHQREPDFWRYFFWVEHVQRFRSEQPQHPESWWFYLPILLVGFLPWTPLLPAAAIGLRQQKGSFPPYLRYAACWFISPFLFYSTAAGKLLTYILPCFPPLVVLVIQGLESYFQTSDRRAFNGGARGMAGFGFLLAIAIAIIWDLPLADKLLRWPEDNHLVGLAIVSALAWGFLSLFAAQSLQFQAKWSCLACSPIIFLFCSHFCLPARVIGKKAPELFWAQFRERIPRESLIVTEPYLSGALGWQFKRQDLYLLGSGELGYGLDYPDSQHRMVSMDQIRNLSTRAGNGTITLIVKQKRMTELPPDFPPPLLLASNGYYTIGVWRFPRSGE